MRTVLALLLLVAALAVAGCGGTSGPESGGGSAETADLGVQTGEGGDSDAPGAENDPIYIEGGNICVNLPLEALAAQYGVEATPEAVAKAVGEDYEGADAAKAEQGCLDILTGGGE
ncbi:MAG TPA: hypothetical protein VK874_02985 [Gaiellaceae bacterium]|nr:hypothetical protein [Gaiellaceae bacterium]